MKDILKDFGQRLKEQRKAANMSQAELAAYLDLDQTTISKYELGTRECNLLTALKIGYLLSWNIGDLMNDYIKEIKKNAIKERGNE